MLRVKYEQVNINLKVKQDFWGREEYTQGSLLSFLIDNQ